MSVYFVLYFWISQSQHYAQLSTEHLFACLPFHHWRRENLNKYVLIVISLLWSHELDSALNSYYWKMDDSFLDELMMKDWRRTFELWKSLKFLLTLKMCHHSIDCFQKSKSIWFWHLINVCSKSLSKFLYPAQFSPNSHSV